MISNKRRIDAWNQSLKRANIQDIPTLNQIAVTSKSHWNYPPEWIEKWMDELTRSERDFTEQHIYKLVLSDKTIGYCAIQEQDPEYEVTNLWVLPTYIGKGYGKFTIERKLFDKLLPNRKVSSSKQIRMQKLFMPARVLSLLIKKKVFRKGDICR